jgi:hypothetical protein
MLHKDYDREVSIEKKISGRESQGAWRQDELIGGIPLVGKNLVQLERSRHSERTWARKQRNSYF